MAKATVESLPENGGIRFIFATGETLVASLGALSPGMVTRLALFGLEQKIRGSFAGADPERCPALAQRIWENLKQGIWTSRPPSTKAMRGTKLLAQAVGAVLRESGRPVPEGLEEMLDALSRSDRAKLRADHRVAAKIAELQAGKESMLDTLF